MGSVKEIVMELWDVLDENGNKTGRLVERGKPLNAGEYHLVVFSFIKNPKGQFLISKRAEYKTAPNTWEITGGAAIAGEDSLSAITREVKEELGIALLRGNGKMVKRIRYETEYSFFADVWIFEEDIDIKDVICQPEEVSDAKWATKEEIKILIKKQIFMYQKDAIINCLELV